jgi:hypothetical protein
VPRRGVRDGWSKNVIKAFYRQRAIDALFSVASGDASQTVVDELSKWKYRRYKSLTDVTSDMKNGMPLSVIIYSKPDNSLVVGSILDVPVRGGGSDWVFHEILLSGTGVYEDPFGYTYFEVDTVHLWHDEVQITDRGSLAAPGLKFHTCGFMLPDHWRRNEKEGGNWFYTVVDDDFRSLTTVRTLSRLSRLGQAPLL